MGKESKKESIHVHVQLIHFAVQQSAQYMPHCKSTILQKNQFFKKAKKVKIKKKTKIANSLLPITLKSLFPTHCPPCNNIGQEG